MENYTNWDTWETVNWCLNVEPIKMAIINASDVEAKNIIIRHMRMVKYSYASDVELDKINIKEVLETIRDR